MAVRRHGLKVSDAQTGLTRTDAVWATVLLASAAALLFGLTANMFPTTEYNDWLNWAKPVEFGDIFRRMTLRESWFSREFSMAVVRQSSLHCGTSLPCLNAWAVAPVVLAIPLLFLLGRAIGLARLVAVAGATAWLVSWPTMDALAWHATAHDRWALVFVLAALLLACLSLPRRASRSVASCAAISGALTVLVWLACNSKEASWFLAPTLVVLAWATSERGGARRVLDTWVSWLPLAYTGWHIYAFQVTASASAEAWLRHVGTGDLLRNAGIYSAALLGLSHRAYAPVALALLFTVVAFFAYRDHRTGQARAHPSVPLWPLWLGFAFAVALPARASAPSPYYMMIPLAVFLPALLAALTRWANGHMSSIPPLLKGPCIPLGASLFLMSLFAFGKLDTYWAFREQSINFGHAVQRIARLPAAALQAPPYFLHHPAAVRATYLLRAEEWRSVWRFGAAPGGVTPIWLDAPVQWNYAWSMPARIRDDNRTLLYLDERLRLREVSTP